LHHSVVLLLFEIHEARVIMMSNPK
jgi:hypothetical protein